DLFINHKSSENAHYSYSKQLLLALQNHNQSVYGAGILKQSYPDSILNLVVTNSSTRTYICGDTTYFLINHFDSVNKMTNIFLKLPEYLPLPRNSYNLVRIERGFEKDSIKHMYLTLVGQVGSVKDSFQCVAYIDKNLGSSYRIPEAILSSHSFFQQDFEHLNVCENKIIQQLYPVALLKYHLYIDSMRSLLISNFRNHIILNAIENFFIMGIDIKHGVTLYYYDIAGNLIQTVPPAGVASLNVGFPMNDTINANRERNEQINPLLPNHTKTSRYKYNSVNKMVQSHTPDGGKTVYRYDPLGRL